MCLLSGAQCLLRLAQVTVGMASDDFILEKALSCHHNFSDAATPFTMVSCREPVRGQFVTIMNHKHIEGDRKRDVFWLGCLSLSDVKIYVKRM